MEEARSSLARFSREDVNPHYLQRVVELSDGNPVLTREDVFDTRGFKLLAKGAVVDDSVVERLLRFKLSKPIETVIGVEEAITVAELASLAEEMLAANAGIAHTLAAINADSLAIRLVKRMKLEGASTMMLALNKKENSRLRHGMMVGLLSVGLGFQAGLPEDKLSALISAGVLHDIGELYVDPAIFLKKQPLDAVEWRHVACHPLIGEMVIRETMSFSPETALFVGEHHERLNGYGYPRLLSGTGISPGGLCVGVAEVIAAIIGREGSDVLRIGCALKLIRGEFPPIAVSLIDQTYRAMRDELGFSPDLLHVGSIPARADDLADILNGTLDWVLNQSPAKTVAGSVFDFVADRLRELRKAAVSAGLVCSSGAFSDEVLNLQEAHELLSACGELRFRVKELCYLASLHADAKSSNARRFVAELCERLLAVPTVEAPA